MQSKYHAFLRISEEVVEAEQELIELQKHVSAQGMLVQDLMSGVCRELEMWQKYSKEEHAVEKDFQCELNEILCVDTQDPKLIFLDEIDILLAEHKLEKALLALETEEKKYMVTDDSGKESDAELSAYKTALLKRKSILEDQLVRYSEQPSLSITELRKSLSGLIKIGKGPVAHQVLLKTYGSRLHRDVEAFLPTCSVYTETYSATLSQLVFSVISKVLKESSTLFGDSPMNMNRIIQWSESEIEAFARLVKENSPLPESVSAFRSACICVQTSLAHCSCLESHGLKFSKLLMLLLRPHIEEVLELNFRRVRRKIIDSARTDDILLLAPQEGSPPSDSVAPKMMLTSSGKKFMSVINVSSRFIDYGLLVFSFWIYHILIVCYCIYESSSM
ncbi:exocyst complex component EXO84C [Hordeum vulgare]|nr:exocyst complex component EXO84C [Hordeum vulgare]